jgi:uncharacterized protein (TIRG00374 family)
MSIKLISILLITYFISKFSFEDFLNDVHITIIITALLVSIFFLCLQTYFAGLRLSISLSINNQKISIKDSWVICQYGGFFSHTPASFVGGDAVRYHLINKTGINKLSAVHSVLLDRFSGFLILGILAFAGAIVLINNKSIINIIYVYAIAIILLLIFILPFFLIKVLSNKFFNKNKLISSFANLVRLIVNVPKNKLNFGYLLALSCMMYIISFFAVYSISLIYGVNISLLEISLVCPIIWLLTMVPLSFGGWGIRESAFISLFSIYNIESSMSFLISITYGAAVFFSYLPGLYFYLRRK